MATKRSISNSINLDFLMEECMGQMGMLENLLAIHRSNMEEFFTTMDASLAQANYARAAFALHKVKCGLRMLKCDSLVGLALEMHENCKSQKPDSRALDEAYTLFKEEYDHADNDMYRAFEQLKLKQ